MLVRGLFAIFILHCAFLFEHSEIRAQTSAELDKAIADVADKHNMGQVWFQAERRDHSLLSEIGIGGAKLDAPQSIASVSKSITGIGIALLIQEEKLNLDTTLGEVVSDYFVKRGKPLDATLKDLSIRRLLTHTAGLRVNYASDPVNGIDNSKFLHRFYAKDDSWKYLMESKADKSNGKTSFTYSNIDYLLLGLVIEAVSGQTYEQFCLDRIFKPIGATSAHVPDGYHAFGGFGAWHMTVADIARVWNVFEVTKPTLVSADVLRATFLAQIGVPLGSNKNRYYTLGAYVTPNKTQTGFAATHDGHGNWYSNEQFHFSNIEKTWPGATWVVISTKLPQKVEGKTAYVSIRKLVNDAEKLKINK